VLGLVIILSVVGWLFVAFLALRRHENLPIKITAQRMVDGISIILLILAIGLGVLAYRNNEQLFGNLATSLGSIAFTVILIDRLNARRILEQRKQEIFAQIRSPVRDVAVEALRLACHYGWLQEVLNEVNLIGVHLEGADLRGENLQGAELPLVKLQGADLRHANLRGAYLMQANLEGANLRVAKFQGAELREANLKDADLLMAEMQTADLRGANLEGADLTETNLKQSYYSKTTKWPVGFSPVKAGAVFEHSDWSPVYRLYAKDYTKTTSPSRSK
jgi:uncharacterized protein YjbI with pentapeptide repeats